MRAESGVDVDDCHRIHGARMGKRLCICRAKSSGPGNQSSVNPSTTEQEAMHASLFDCLNPLLLAALSSMLGGV